MNYGKISACDTANGPGLRVTLFISGCRHHCRDCFNSETWNFDYEKRCMDETTDKIIEMLRDSYINGLTIMGGDPFEPENQIEVFNLISKVRHIYGKSKSIWVYSGYTFEELMGEKVSKTPCRTAFTKGILERIDVLVDGEFVREQKDITLPFRDSRNQRVLDVSKSLETQKPVWNEKYV